MSNRHAHQARSALFLGTALGLMLHPMFSWANEPQQTQTCNEPPPAPPTDQQPLVTGQWLEPGSEVHTRGTGAAQSPELNGPVVFAKTYPFAFETVQGRVSGTYKERVIQGADQRCKCELRIHVEQGCVAEMRVHSFVHPRGIVADYRNDLPGGGVASRTATRSADGSVFTFALRAPICAGQASRWLLLNTDVDELERTAALGIVAAGGESSQLQPVFVPKLAP